MCSRRRALAPPDPGAEAAGRRAQGIEREYDELDTVWFMAGSLFRNYPYDVPTEAFSLQIFRQVRPCRAPAQRIAGMQG
jgi:hypothetical protein